MYTDAELALLCRKIRFLRIQNNLSQQEMAKRLGVSVASLQKIEQNHFPDGVRCSVFQNLNREFNIKFADMFTNADFALE